METTYDAVDQLAINTIRTLSMDAVERASSGHPGAPMGLAPAAYLLFTQLLKHSPIEPDWPDRDRFVLSCGHASMLLYSTLHLAGYEISLDDLRSFRQWGSITPGHPEQGMTPGVEVTSGPLGQGCASSVGMALAEAHLAEQFNRDGHTIVDHHTWVLCSDGDLMEGLSSEAASLAGHLGLGKLIWIWDDNRITIEGSTDLAFGEDVEQRFCAFGWQVQRVDDMNDLEALAAACSRARACRDQPSFIAVRSHIAFGAPNKQGSASSHGSPLGAEEIRATKQGYGWPNEQPFFVPDEVRSRFRQRIAGGAEQAARWHQRLAQWQVAYPELAAQWARRLRRELPDRWQQQLPVFAAGDTKIATRAASGKVINALAETLPELIGGSADLDPSCKTRISSSGSISRRAFGERNIHFGIREHAMGALLNGMALHGGLRPLGSTFLVFADYLRPAIRLAALMHQPVIYVFTHDSIWVGEDGPTHQPVEQLLSLRSIPGLTVIRPADANETAAAWQIALTSTGNPTALALSRQSLPVLEETQELAPEGLSKGAYVVREAAQTPDLVLIASGSELHLALAAAAALAEQKIKTRVVSMPSWELFDRQPEGYRDEVLLSGVPRLAIEAGVSRGWRDYVGSDGGIIAIDRFGASAPGQTVATELGLTVEAVVARALAIIKTTAGESQ